MILGDADIERRLDEGDLVIEPLDDPTLQIQPASVDLRLGREFLEFNRTNIACIHPDREDEVDEYITKTTVPPNAGAEQTTLMGYDADERRERNEFILHPGDFVLGTTMERVEIPPDLIAHVEGRSSLGRLAIVVHASLPYDEEVFLWTPEAGFGFYPIGEIVENERSARAVAFDPQTLQVRTHRVTDYISNPTKRIYRVKLASGRSVHVTQDHNLFTLDAHGGVQRIPSEAAEGQLVMIPGRLPEPHAQSTTVDIPSHRDTAGTVTSVATDGRGTSTTERGGVQSGSSTRAQRATGQPASTATSFSESRPGMSLPDRLSVTEDLGWVLGVYLATGEAQTDHLVFDHAHPEVLDRVAAWFEEFDTPMDRYRPKRGGHPLLVVRGSQWVEVFTSLAGAGDEKAIPDAAWNWSNTVLTALLTGLTTGESDDGGLPVGSSRFKDQLMYLAARVGETFECTPPAAESSPQTDRGGMNWIGERNENSQTAVGEVPVPGALLRDLRNAAELTITEAAEAIDALSVQEITDLETGTTRSITRARLQEIQDAYSTAGVETGRLDQILGTDVVFDRVETVERTERVEPTYDLEVQPNGRAIENFIGGRGGMFLSNTAGIVDPGYRGQITLELSNLGTAPVALTPGMRISQLTFTELKSPARRPYGQERGSKYQDQEGPQASRIQSDHEFHGDQK